MNIGKIKQKIIESTVKAVKTTPTSIEIKTQNSEMILLGMPLGYLGRKLTKRINIGKMPDGVIGYTHIQDAKGNKVKVQIEKSTKAIGESYSLKDLEGNELGSRKLVIEKADKKKKINYGPIDNPIKTKGYLYLKQLDSYASKCPLSDVQSKTPYTGIGTRLQQIALERSFEEGFKGHMELGGIAASLGFHYKNGFRPVKKLHNGFNIEKEILDSIQNKETIKNIKIASMYMPPENIDILRKKYGGLNLSAE